MIEISNRTFLEAAFADMPPGAHTIVTAFHGDPATKDRKLSALYWRGEPWWPGQPWNCRYNDRNTFYTVSSFEADPLTGELRRRKAQFVQLHIVMVDDINTKVPWGNVSLEPSALIETSPANFQGCYFLTDDADARTLEVCERLVNRMIKAGLAIESKDPGMAGVTRYARLPVGTNQKPKYVKALGAPFTVRPERFEPTRRYSIMEIAQAYRLDMTPEPTRVQTVNLTPEQIGRAGQSFQALLELFKAMGMYHGKNGSGGWHQVTCPWVAEHTDCADTGAALSEPSADNNYAGGFVCHHKCRNVRGMRDVRAWVRALHTLAQGSAAA